MANRKGCSMKKLSYYLTLIVLITMSSISFAGNESGGGGGVFIMSDQTVLVDLLLLNKSFKDSNEYDYLGKKYTTSYAEIDQSVHQSPAIGLALAQLRIWSGGLLGSGYVYPILSGLFSSKLKWTFVDHPVSAPTEAYYLPESLSDMRRYFKLAAFYIRKSIRPAQNEYSVIINRNLWNQMGIRSQAGLLIHELARHYQMGSSLDGRLYFSEAALQQATFIITNCKFHLELDYALATILNGRNEYSFNEKAFEDLIKSYCVQI